MKKCIKCGTIITNGINGCQMLEECFSCHGGYPVYAKTGLSPNRVITDDDMDAIEDRCLQADDRPL